MTERSVLADNVRLGLAALLLAAALSGAEAREAARIQPWEEDARYWQYQGEPVLLVGVSDQDNLFNHPDIEPDGLEAHLDTLVEAGGNYVRNTMSSRDEENLWPFAQDEETGLYDLREPNEAYWDRFRDFLGMTIQRGVIVQIELWDRFDYARDPWDVNPFNPKNNINYTAEESGLLELIESHPGQRENDFFRSIPELDDNELILPHQEAHARRMIEISLDYGHVLYCISNETNDTEEWSRHWAHFLRDIAEEHGKGIEVTEMWDPWDLQSEMHERTFDHPDLYSFVDVSQNSHQVGQTQWDNLQWVRERVADPPRPVNNVKTYGGVHGGGPEEGQHKLWRNILGGTASSRYHRPGGGIGMSEVTLAHVRSLREVGERVDLIAAEPMNGLLSDREEDEAYLAAIPGEAYALYFPDGGSVTLDLGEVEGAFELRWLGVLEVLWEDAPIAVEGGGSVEVTSPGEGPWAAVLTRP